MIKKIFRSIFLVSIVSFLCSMAVLLLVLYGYIRPVFIDAIIEETKYIGAGVELGGKPYLEKLQIDSTVIWTDTDGAVLFDSRLSMNQPHEIDWQEAGEAIEAGEGIGVWHTGQTINCALQLQDGDLPGAKRGLGYCAQYVWTHTDRICPAACIIHWSLHCFIQKNCPAHP